MAWRVEILPAADKAFGKLELAKIGNAPYPKCAFVRCGKIVQLQVPRVRGFI